MVTILNTSILTSFGSFSYTPATVQEVKNLLVSESVKQGIEIIKEKLDNGDSWVKALLVSNNPVEIAQFLAEQNINCLCEPFEFQSAVGHQSTCDVLTSLLGVTVPMNRIQYSQQVGDIAIVFKLKGRPEEGKILTAEEIEAIGYEFGILKMLK